MMGDMLPSDSQDEPTQLEDASPYTGTKQNYQMQYVQQQMRKNIGAKNKQNLVVKVEDGSTSSDEDDLNGRKEGDLEEDE